MYPSSASNRLSRAAPLVERGPFLWLWPGEPDRADLASIPDHGQCGFDDPAQQAEAGTLLHLDTRYQLLNERGGHDGRDRPPRRGAVSRLNVLLGGA